MFKRISLNGSKGFYHGNIDIQGKISIYDPDGNLLHGDLDDTGKINLHGFDGYYYGNLNGNTISIHCPNGDYLNGSIS